MARTQAPLMALDELAGACLLSRSVPDSRCARCRGARPTRHRQSRNDLVAIFLLPVHCNDENSRFKSIRLEPHARWC
jgi:hypothetical protein